MSNSLSILKKLQPELDKKIQVELSDIWDKVVGLILDKMALISKEKYKNDKIHYLLMEEMKYEYIKLNFFITEKIVTDKIKSINLLDINIEEEKNRCFTQNGLMKIDNTVNNLFIGVWDKLHTSWIEKSKKLFEKEKNKIPPKPRKPQHVDDNHYITKSFIKNYWTDKNLNINKYSIKYKKHKECSYGKFGKLSNIYSDRLEDYFSLLEKDATEPIKKLTNFIPMNLEEKKAIVGFIVIHFLRNPYGFKLKYESLLKSEPIIKEYLNKNISVSILYEALFENNKFYSNITKNILNNKWILLKSEEKLFILPDTVLYYKWNEEGQVVIFPISPTQCLIILNEKDTRDEAVRCIESSKLLTIEQSIMFSKFLFDISTNDVIVDKNFFDYKDEILNTTVQMKNILDIVQS